MLEITVTMNNESETYLAKKLPFEIRCKGIVTLVIKEVTENEIKSDVCPYCKVTKVEKLNNINVRCRFCGGSGSVK